MKGTVKWFNYQKGFGFITDSEGNDVFVHHTQIQMDGFRKLDEGDIVEFELGTTDKTKRVQAVNVQLILTLDIVKEALNKQGLHLSRTVNKDNFNLPWMVCDANNVIQTSENGMSLVELAEYAGIDISGLKA